MPRIPTPEDWARAVWAAAEPCTLFGLLNPGVQAAMAAYGQSGMAAYAVVRAAPMGAVHPAVAVAAFRSLPAAAIGSVLPAAWRSISPEQAVEVAHTAVAETFRDLPGAPAEDRVARLVELLRVAVGAAETAGRPLGAANAAVPLPADPWAAAWRALTALRELRGDGHVAALVAADLDLVESEVLMVGWAAGHIDVPALRSTRQLDDRSWAAGIGRLADRGYCDPAGGLTAAGLELRAEIEQRTDVAAAAPWRELGPEAAEEVWSGAAALSGALVDAGRIHVVTPVGAPWPPVHPREPAG